MNMGNCGFNLRAKRVLLALGFTTLLIWFAFILSAFILYILGYNVPKTLISMEAIISCAGYSWMLKPFRHQIFIKSL